MIAPPVLSGLPVPSPVPVQPVVCVECGGTPWDMGVCQGVALRERIGEALQTLAALEAVQLMKPRYVPFPVFLRLAELKAARFLRRAFRVAPLSAERRLRGLAFGAGVPFRKLALCGAMEAALSDLGAITSIPVTAACSAVALTRSAVRDGHPMLAHNFDYLPVTQPFYVVRRSLPLNQLRSVEFTVAPLAGAVSGVNEAGLCVTCDYAYATDRGGPAPTVTMLLSEVLAQCRTVEQAVGLLSRTPRVGGGLLMLGDESGTIASVEISSTRLERRDPIQGRDRLGHTNRFHCPAMRAVEVNPQAVHGKRSPEALRGRRVHQSAEEREQTLQRLLDSESVFDRELLHGLMSSHGPSGEPSSGTICMHSNYWHTTASLQLFPVERRLRIAFSPTCMAEYSDFTA